ncbi:MAG: beta-lactamase class A [Promethearchaeota archaeon CR_4]|nr:MAG: beta-lactamase class A [Candidatus Lokiarchaeota archaeon CR_4]
MNKKIIFALIFGIIGVAATITVVVLWPKNPSTLDREQIAKELLEKVYRANTTGELDSCFTTQFKQQITMDYLLYLLDSLKSHLNFYQNGQIIPITGSGIFNYTVNMQNGNISGQIIITVTKLISGFSINKINFFESYLTTLVIDDIVDEFNTINGNKSLFIARDDDILLDNSVANDLAVASTFKLYVLEALRQKVDADPDINWQTTIPILNKLKSLPSGVMHTWENGTLVTLQTMADYMISISDNTATDHLIHYLNRTYVESFLPTDYALPLLKTAESFKLRWLLDDTELQYYLTLNITQKQVYLDTILYDLDINLIYNKIDLDIWEGIDIRKQIEWYFNSTEIVKIKFSDQCETQNAG